MCLLDHCIKFSAKEVESKMKYSVQKSKCHVSVSAGFYCSLLIEFFLNLVFFVKLDQLNETHNPLKI